MARALPKREFRLEHFEFEKLDRIALEHGETKGANGTGGPSVNSLLRSLSHHQWALVRLPDPLGAGRQAMDECYQFIKEQQPFQITYTDVADRSWIFSVRYASVEHHFYSLGRARYYLDCWCEEIEGNQDIPELAHNWSLRFDRIKDCILTPISGSWRDGKDTVDVSLHLDGGLAAGYEGRLNDISDTWQNTTRIVVRRIDSTYWLFKDIAGYGSQCRVAAPEAVKLHLGKELQQMAASYL